MSFWPGQRVECVSPKFDWLRKRNWLARWLRPDGPDPRRGRVYVVEAVSAAYGVVWLDVSGYPNVRYAAEGFRPIVETEMQKLAEIAAKPELMELEPC